MTSRADRKAVGRPVPAARTLRHVEVADLVADGLSNPQIATRLFISVRTAQGHVENILRKLGFNSRSLIAAWVTQRRLADKAHGADQAEGNVLGTPRSAATQGQQDECGRRRRPRGSGQGAVLDMHAEVTAVVEVADHRHGVALVERGEFLVGHAVAIHGDEHRFPALPSETYFESSQKSVSILSTTR